MRYAVILAGGGGTRLWPASRRARPKQLLALGTPGGRTLLRATGERLRAWPIVAVTAAEQAAGVRAELDWLGDSDVVIEPAGRNTAAALGLAAMALVDRDPDAVMAAMPADHHVADDDAFRAALETAFAAAEASDVIVTIGIAPTAPEVGYGYLEVGAARDDGTREVTRFVEKPDAATAVKYVASGYLWNGGMFIVRAQRLLDEIERHMPDTFAGLQARTDDAYLAVPSISIDYGVMERATGVVTVPGDFGWHDVGSWGALAAYRHADENGNVCDGDAVLVDAKRNITVTDDGVIALIGVEDLVVVRSGNAVLVAPRDRAQDVRAVVAELQRRGRDDYL